eukprot:scaffold69879_cov21-Phaeocystis_antarctica.AAC.1
MAWRMRRRVTGPSARGLQVARAAGEQGDGAGEQGEAGRPPPEHADLDLRPGQSTGGAGQAPRSDPPLYGGARGD